MASEYELIQALRSEGYSSWEITAVLDLAPAAYIADPDGDPVLSQWTYDEAWVRRGLQACKAAREARQVYDARAAAQALTHTSGMVQTEGTMIDVREIHSWPIIGRYPGAEWVWIVRQIPDGRIYLRADSATGTGFQESVYGLDE